MTDTALRAVIAATSACRFVQRRLDTVRAITKDDRSPVTVADFAAQAIVAHVLRDALGEICLVAEETSAFLRDPAHALHLEAAIVAAREGWPDTTPDDLLEAIDVGAGEPHANGYWTLDPIDGTKGFIRGQQYAVCLAYVVGRDPVIGVLGCPNLPRSHDAPLDVQDPEGSLFVAERGAGAFAVRADDPSSPAAPSRGNREARLRCAHWEPGMPISMCESVDSGHSDHSAAASIVSRIAPARAPVRLDSQCKYAVVARGQADLYFRLPTKKGYVERIWDHAAGAVIAHEAGCAVSDIRGNPLDFSHGRGLEKNRGTVVAHLALQARVIAVAHDVLPVS